MGQSFKFKRFRADETGSALVEYVVLLGLLVASATVGIDLFAKGLEDAWQRSGASLFRSVSPASSALRFEVHECRREDDIVHGKVCAAGLATAP